MVARVLRAATEIRLCEPRFQQLPVLGSSMNFYASCGPEFLTQVFGNCAFSLQKMSEGFTQEI